MTIERNDRREMTMDMDSAVAAYGRAATAQRMAEGLAKAVADGTVTDADGAVRWVSERADNMREVASIFGQCARTVLTV